jgi:branched-chain amino acid transport system permease protein
MSPQIAFALINGLTTGMAVFLVAAGITLIFGILKILNFAHGSFFMVGAYVTYTFVGNDPASVPILLGACVAAGLVVGGLGWVTDRLVLRRLRDVPEAYTLIATFALLMLCNGVVKLVWGIDYHAVNPPDALADPLQLGPTPVPTYSVLIVLASVLVFMVLDFAIHRLWIGKIVQALVNDPWMASLIGVNVERLFTGTVIVAFFLAGLAGGLLLPNQSLSPDLSSSYLMQTFIVVIIGGLGNIRGAFLASILLGLVDSLNAIFLPALPGVAIYVAMVGFLLWRPQGLLRSAGGERTQDSHGAAGQAPSPRTVFPGPFYAWIGLAVAALLGSVPYWANDGLLFLVGVALIEALFAISWNLLFGFAGLTSFGHAALFAAGAYFVGYVLKAMPAVPFLGVLTGAWLLGAAMANLIGRIAVGRVAGIGLGILTLAMGELLRILISHATPLGRDDGLSAIPRPTLLDWPVPIPLQSASAYYWFLCAACGGIALLLWLVVSGPFGRVLRCIRQDAERTSFLGVQVARYRLIVFTLSGSVAAVAGGLFAPWAQIVTPESGSYLHSAQPMLDSLLGGAEWFWGPVLGAFLFAALQYGTRTLIGLSDVTSGLLLLLVVLGSPTGFLGLRLRRHPKVR